MTGSGEATAQPRVGPRLDFSLSKSSGWPPGLSPAHRARVGVGLGARAANRTSPTSSFVGMGVASRGASGVIPLLGRDEATGCGVSLRETSSGVTVTQPRGSRWSRGSRPDRGWTSCGVLHWRWLPWLS